jgi:hypothetical protein
MEPVDHDRLPALLGVPVRRVCDRLDRVLARGGQSLGVRRSDQGGHEIVYGNRQKRDVRAESLKTGIPVDQLAAPGVEGGKIDLRHQTQVPALVVHKRKEWIDRVGAQERDSYRRAWRGVELGSGVSNEPQRAGRRVCRSQPAQQRVRPGTLPPVNGEAGGYAKEAGMAGLAVECALEHVIKSAADPFRSCPVKKPGNGTSRI